MTEKDKPDRRKMALVIDALVAACEAIAPIPLWMPELIDPLDPDRGYIVAGLGQLELFLTAAGGVGGDD